MDNEMWILLLTLPFVFILMTFVGRWSVRRGQAGQDSMAAELMDELSLVQRQLHVLQAGLADILRIENFDHHHPAANHHLLTELRDRLGEDRAGRTNGGKS